MDFKKMPNHIGIIPDGNRRWAVERNLSKEEGYTYGVTSGFLLCEDLVRFGVEEVTIYGFAKDNTARPKIQTKAFVSACVESVHLLSEKDASLLVVGNTKSKIFPKELLKYTKERFIFGTSKIKINFLMNYSWNWDLKNYKGTGMLASSDIPRIDLIIRWGGQHRLSGFLPIQSVYADFYFIEEYWPDYKTEHLENALNWYQNCEVTLGG